MKREERHKWVCDVCGIEHTTLDDRNPMMHVIFFWPNTDFRRELDLCDDCYPGGSDVPSHRIGALFRKVFGTRKPTVSTIAERTNGNEEK